MLDCGDFHCIILKEGMFCHVKCVIMLDWFCRDRVDLLVGLCYLLKIRLVVWVNSLNVTAEVNRISACAKSNKRVLPFKFVVDHVRTKLR